LLPSSKILQFVFVTIIKIIFPKKFQVTSYFHKEKLKMAQIEKRKPIFVTVDHLKPQTSGHNLKLKVVSVKISLEKERIDSSEKIRIAECVVGDATGCITLTARNEQIQLLSPGKSIIVRNSKIYMFKNFMRLVVDKWGKIQESPENFNFEVNTKNDLSAVEYELITIPE